jgi:hypothetical protein
MTYYPDLTSLPTNDQKISGKFFAIGWLDNQHKYPQGPVSNTFIERLWIFCRYPALVTRGFHLCEFCPPVKRNVEFPGLESPYEILRAQREGTNIKLGYAEIDVFDENGTIYHAPNLIYHYVLDHKYRPPEPFIQAVLTGPPPNTEEYKSILKKLGWGNVVDLAAHSKK